MDWVEAIGYQKEAVHTGALRHLLAGPPAIAADVACALTGNGEIAELSKPRTEEKLRKGSRRLVDLAADLRLKSGGAGRLGVEVKVDSAWSPSQLRNSVDEEDHGVLLAVGYTALAVSDRDLAAIEDYRWRRVPPGAFARIVREHARGDSELLRYADCLNSEADDHAEAIRAVRDGETVKGGREPQLLEHWAYFSEIVQHRDDVADWERGALISGPLMTLWVVRHGDDAGDYLQFMGEEPGRSLCVKTWAQAGTGLLASSRDRLIELLGDLNPKTPKAPSATDKTCTAAKFPLNGIRPVEAAELATTLIGRLRG